MFADDVCILGIPDYDPKRMAPVLAKIRDAQKFQLSADFAAAADELRTDFNQVAKALPLCRLPAALTWIECSEAHRNRHDGYGTALRWTQAPVKRVGFLLAAERPDDLSRFRAYQFWENTGEPSGMRADMPGLPPPNCIKAAMHIARFDMTGESAYSMPSGRKDEEGIAWRKASLEAREALAHVVEAQLAEYSPPLSFAALAGHPDLIRAATQEMVYDWNGEPAYIEAVLALLNARNTSETKLIDKTEHNRKRAKRGQKPLFDYYMLTIHPRQMARVRASYGGDAPGAVRAHFVRGHWKVRKTGIFFWLPHQRGSLREGRVEKDYKVAL
jgi:hypothetical protein